MSYNLRSGVAAPNTLHSAITQLNKSIVNFSKKKIRLNNTEAEITQQTIGKMSNLTDVQEDSYESIIEPPLHRKSDRRKRGLIHLGGKLAKFWIHGFIEELQKGSRKWKSTTVDNVQLIQNTLKEVKEKSEQFQSTQDNFKHAINEMEGYFSQQKLYHLYQQFIFSMNQ